METFEKEHILKLLAANRGISIENIIEYLDYTNKIRYSKEEVSLFLDDLQKEGKIYTKNGLWCISAS